MFKQILVFALGAIGGGLLVWWCLSSVLGHWAQREAFVQPAAEVVNSISVLNRLHEGDVSAAVEALEHNLDGDLIGLSLYSSNEVPAAEHGLIESSLRQAREYRTQHPRTNDVQEVQDAIAKALEVND